MNRLIRIPALFLFGLLSCLAGWAQADRPSPTSSLAFADWLVQQKEFTRATGEYYRVLFAAPEAGKPALLRKIGWCYEQAGEFRQALLVYEKLIADSPTDPLVEETYYRSAYCSFKLREYDASSAQIRRRAALGELSAPFLLLDGVDRLSSGDYTGGATLLDRYLAGPDADRDDPARTLRSLAEEAASLPTRNGWTAGLFSVLLPGAGKVYAGRWEDGLVSFLLCAFLGGMAAYTFLNEGAASFKAWVYAGLGAIFYIGDVWGSAVAADRFNADRKAELAEKVKSSVAIIFP